MRSTWTPTTKIVVVSVFLILLGLFMYAIRPLIGPIVVAALLAYTLYPLVGRLENHPRISHNGAVLLVYIPFLILLFATPGTIVPLLARQIRTLTDEVVLVFNSIEGWLAEPVVFLGQTISQEQLAAFLNSATETFTPAAEDAIQVLEATSTSLIWLVVILVTTYYLLADWEGLRRWFINIFPSSEQMDLVQLLHEMDATWRAYLRGTLMLMFLMGIFFIVVGLAIGLPGAVALGLLTGLLSMVPEIGPMIAGILASLVAFLEGSNYLPLSNFWFALLIAGIYIVVMQLKSLWIRPIVMGRFMHMNTGLVFVAIIGAALIFGILAALIVLPVIASAGQIGHYVRCKLLDMDPYP
ncbi:MAG: AI-2E family transporter [Ardenticatenaceae bacterium]|nr:AI-2E family transporter [Ardenticatenaceae bacterium]